MKVGCRLADIQNVAENEQRHKLSANSWLGMKKKGKKRRRRKKKEKEIQIRIESETLVFARVFESDASGRSEVIRVL